MRQSRKEAKHERMANRLPFAERREALAFREGTQSEFAEEWGGGGSASGGRHPGDRTVGCRD